MRELFFQLKIGDFLSLGRRAKPQSSVGRRIQWIPCHHKLVSSEAEVATSCKFLNLILKLSTPPSSDIEYSILNHRLPSSSVYRERCFQQQIPVSNSIIKLQNYAMWTIVGIVKKRTTTVKNGKRLSNIEFELFYSCWGFASACTWTESENLFIFQFIRTFHIFSKIYRQCTESNMRQRDAINSHFLISIGIFDENLTWNFNDIENANQHEIQQIEDEIPIFNGIFSSLQSPFFDSVMKESKHRNPIIKMLLFNIWSSDVNFPRGFYNLLCVLSHHIFYTREMGESKEEIWIILKKLMLRLWWHCCRIFHILKFEPCLDLFITLKEIMLCLIFCKTTTFVISL